MKYLEVTFNVPSERAQDAADLAWESGADGVYLEDYSDLTECILVRQTNLVDEELLAKDRTKAILHLYFEPNDDPPPIVDALKERLTAAEIPYLLSSGDTEDEDWLYGWKKYYKPLHVGKITVVPAWEEYTPADGEIPLIIDPGLAFGTGSHETTSCCLEALQTYVTPGDAVLDVGCGSGILSIAALLCGADSALGIDIDPNAARVSSENAALNPSIANRYRSIAGNILDTKNDSVLTETLTDRRYRVVVGNLVADVVIPLSAAVRDYMEEGGIFISSGILSARAGEVRAALEQNGFEILEEKRKNEWVCFVAR